MDITSVSHLANLPLGPEEEKLFSSQLNQIVDYVGQLQKVDISKTIPTHQVTGKKNVTRDDHKQSSLPIELSLSGSIHTQNHHFVVPRVLDNE